MPRYFGLTPPTLLFSLAAAALAAAIVLAILAHWLAAILLALVSLVLLALFVGVAQRKPDSAVARSSARVFVRARDRTAWMVESLALRSAAGREASRLRQALLAANSRRESLLLSLGEAVYRGDPTASETMKKQIRAVDGEIEELETSMHAVAQDTRERIEQGRRRVEPTLIETPEPQPPQPPEIPEPSPPPDEGTPPQPPTIPEPYPPPDEGTPPAPAPVPEPGPDQDL
jgi:TolA-binding protein